MDVTALPTTRAEAKATGAKHYFTGEPCKYGHVAPRKTKGACLDCLKNEWEEGNKKRAAYFRQYGQSDAGQAAKKRYYETNKEAVKEKAKARAKEDKQQYRKKWASENLIAVRAKTKVRRRKHRAATPRWLTKTQVTQMRDIYERAIAITRLTGIKHVVDHIIPLVHPDICGLHVPWNLRILTQDANAAKSNFLPSEDLWLAFAEGA
jgi:hypothetical protein